MLPSRESSSTKTTSHRMLTKARSRRSMRGLRLPRSFTVGTMIVSSTGAVPTRGLVAGLLVAFKRSPIAVANPPVRDFWYVPRRCTQLNPLVHCYLHSLQGRRPIPKPVPTHNRASRHPDPRAGLRFGDRGETWVSAALGFRGATADSAGGLNGPNPQAGGPETSPQGYRNALQRVPGPAISMRQAGPRCRSVG